MSIFLTGFAVFFPFLGALAVYGMGKKNERLRDYAADLVTVLVFGAAAVLLIKFGGIAENQTDVWDNAAAFLHVKEICGFGLNFELDGFRMIYMMTAAFMWMMTTVFSREYLTHHDNRNRYYVFVLLTLGATMGVFLSADLLTTFIFFEIMSFTSYVWVAQEENEPALRAAGTYLAVAVIGGLVMLMGIFMLYHELGTVMIDEIHSAAASCPNKRVLYAAGICMLTGFGAKAGAFPLHIWLPKAHPVAPAPASALLSGILTKTGVYGMLLLTANLFLHDMAWGKLLLVLGVATMFGGALLAVFSIDLKRTLACSSMSQIGFIMVGIGMQGMLGEENALAVHGTFLHMMNHSMIKLTLFMAAGVIFMNTHSLDLNVIRGYGRKKPFLKLVFAAGALAISGIPFFGGYISKTLLHESIVEFGGGWMMKAAESIFLFSGGLTAAYMTKLFAAIFIEENESGKLQRKYDQQKKYLNEESCFALGGSAAILLIWGFMPGLMDRAAGLGQSLMRLEEFGEEVSYFSLKNLSGAAISIAIGALVYLLVIRKLLMVKTGKGQKAYVNLWPAWWDVESVIYRPVLLGLLPLVGGFLCRLADSFADTVVVFLRKTIYHDSPLPHDRPEGNAITELIGKVMNGFRDLGNRTWNRKNPVTTDYIHEMAVRSAERRQSNMVIGRSMSFALLLFCIGFILTLFYLILW